LLVTNRTFAYCSDFLRPEERKAHKGTRVSFTWKDSENCHTEQQGNSLRTKTAGDIVLTTEFFSLMLFSNEETIQHC